MMWPAFWAYTDGIPIDADLVEEAAIGVLDVEQQVGNILAKLAGAENAPGDPLFATHGNLYRRNVDGGLDWVGRSISGVSWVWFTETNMVSTIPEFDVSAEEIDYDAEGAIVAIMDALKPLDVVLVTQGKLFAKDADGYLAGTNSAWASGWHTQDGAPLVSPFAERAVVDTVGSAQSLNEEQVVLMLQKLGDTACYISNGRKFSLSGDTLVDEDHEAAAPVSWPIGHDVRSAAQSLGARECQECHSVDSPFFFGTVTATGPLVTDRAREVPMHEFQDLESGFNKLFGLTFKVRSCFKAALAILAVLLGLIVLAVGLAAIYGLMEKLETTRIKGLTPLLMICMAVLAITGFGFGWPASSPLDGFPLLGHVGFGALFAVVLAAWALLRAKSAGNAWFWLLVVCGIVLILSILLAMFPLLGTHGQHICIVIHRVAALLGIAAAAMCCLVARKNG